MGVLLAAYREDACCLCGAAGKLTGEHKIKASALQDEFGSDTLAVGSIGDPNGRMRYLQSIKSKGLHFRARMCAKCNNERTQAADREFDRFHGAVRDLVAAEHEPHEVFNSDRYAVGGEPYLNVFRYFAKVLCCQLADVGGPRRLHVARFALGQEQQNCVWLQIKDDWTYRQIAAAVGPQQYAAHGGLVLYGDKLTGCPNAFHSTLTLGPIQYVFHSRLTWLERFELQLLHRDFLAFCSQRAVEATKEPMSEGERLSLGLDQDDME